MLYLICFSILGLARGADILSTWVVTPDLRLERNRLMRRLGWPGILCFNALIVVLCSFSPNLSVGFAFASLLFARHNLLTPVAGRYSRTAQDLLAVCYCGLLLLIIFRVPGSTIWDCLFGFLSYLLTIFIWTSKHTA